MAPVTSLREAQLLESLRDGDESAFALLVDEHGPGMLRVAKMYVRTRAVAEEVVQEAWLGVLRGIDRFEGRSSLRTWIFRILTNVAKTRAVREGRSVPFSTLALEEESRARRFHPSASGTKPTAGRGIGRFPRKNGDSRTSSFSRPRRGAASPRPSARCRTGSGR